MWDCEYFYNWKTFTPIPNKCEHIKAWSHQETSVNFTCFMKFYFHKNELANDKCNFIWEKKEEYGGGECESML